MNIRLTCGKCTKQIMIPELKEGSEVDEQMGMLNPHPRARLTVAFLAAIIMIAPVTALANAPLKYVEQEADNFIMRIENRYSDHIDSAAMLTDYDRDMIVSVIAIESEGNPRATSPVGARGLMQLMPGTAKYFGVKDLSDPFQNILAGTKYLKELENQYGFATPEEALIAYNMGPARAKRFLSQYDSSDHAYVKRVKLVYNRIQERRREEERALALKSVIDAEANIMSLRPTPVLTLVNQLMNPIKVAEASASK
jgi:soluble lytic murein transglycosylase-like protein